MTERSILPRRVPNALLLFILPLPLLAEMLGSLVQGEILEMLAAAGALAGFYAAGMMMRRGLLQEAVLGARRYVVKRPKPIKTLASIFAGAATAAVSLFLVEDHSLIETIAYGIGATVGCLMLYGPDPRPRWSRTDMDRARAEEVMAALGGAEEKVLAIERANNAIYHPELTARLDHVCKEAREILDLLEKNPDQVRHARRFLNTYLDGAHQVADGYARTHSRAGSDELEGKFRNVLATIEEAFEEQHRKLLADDVMDLDVKIQVLKTQLDREGV